MGRPPRKDPSFCFLPLFSPFPMTLKSWLRPTEEVFFPDGLPQDALLLGEAPDTVVLCRHGNRPEARWTRADVFTEDWNLRVRRLGDAARIVAAGPVPGLSGLGAPEETRSLSEEDVEEKRIVLWGRRNAGESTWLELRVPHLMSPETHLHPEDHGTEHTDQTVRRQLLTVRHKGKSENGGFQRYAGLRYAETDSDDTRLDPLPVP